MRLLARAIRLVKVMRLHGCGGDVQFLDVFGAKVDGLIASNAERWSKREVQLHTLLDFTAGAYGKIEGIAGQNLAEIEALGETLLVE